jgi:branched-subunit amino acid ABC-type transport system permease component
MGIDTDKAYRIAFGLSSGITAIAGGLMATYLSFGPFVGLDYVIIMYSGVVLGGMGSILGAFWEASPSGSSSNARRSSCRRNCRTRRFSWCSC